MKIILKEDKMKGLMRGMIKEELSASSPYSKFYGRAELEHTRLYEMICCNDDSDYTEEEVDAIYDWCEDTVNGVEVEARYWNGLEVDLYGVMDGIRYEIENCDLLDDKAKHRAFNWVDEKLSEMYNDYEDYFEWEEYTPEDFRLMNIE